MIILYLTCADETEAQKISGALLQAKLIACARRMPVASANWWKGEIEQATEVLLMMESIEEKFVAVEKLVDTLHSYEEFALTAVSVLKTTPGVEKWLAESLGK
jgi:periplasmic divalent cation tolerance protein